MIAISKRTQDTNGTVIINENSGSKIYDGFARVSRSKTLDGGVVIDHQGVIAGDRTINITCEVSEDDETIIRSLFENETLIGIATKDGFYNAAIESMVGDNGSLKLSILIKEAA